MVHACTVREGAQVAIQCKIPVASYRAYRAERSSYHARALARIPCIISRLPGDRPTLYTTHPAARLADTLVYTRGRKYRETGKTERKLA